MTGYSSKPLIEKLGIKSKMRIAVINEPINFLEKLGKLPPDVQICEELEGKFDYIHIFTSERVELENIFSSIEGYIYKVSQVWVSWPKATAIDKIATDLNENVVRDIGLKLGLVDVKVAAIDETWSGLKFVYRLKDR